MGIEPDQGKEKSIQENSLPIQREDGPIQAVSLVPYEARHRNDHREAGEGAQEARHLWVALQPRHQTAGQSGLSRRLLIPQDPLLHQAGLVPGNAVLDKA